MAIQMRRGNFAEFDPTRMVAGEFAVCLDNGYVYMTLSPGNVIRLGTAETIEEALAQAQEYATQARTAASNAQTYATNADTSAETSESWAVGKKDGTDVPDTDPAYHNNAKYWSDQAYIIQGTVEDLLENFEDKIPTASVARNPGDDYATVTITDQYGTTSAVINDGISPDLEATATVNSEVGTPAVEVTRTGTQEEPVFNFAFSNLKGDTGNTGATGRGVSSLVMSGTGKEHPITATYSDGTSAVVGTLRDGEDGTGSGDMTKATYDQNNNGLVDNAEALSNGTDRLTYADVASGIQGAGGASTLIEDTVGWIGKNYIGALFGKFWNSSGVLQDSANTVSSNKFAVNEGDEFIASKKSALSDSDHRMLVREFDSNGAFVSSSNALNYNSLSNTYTVPSGIKYIAISQNIEATATEALQAQYEVMFRKAFIADSTFVPYHDNVLEVLRDAEVIEGKNKNPYPYYDSTKTTNGISYVDNNGIITIQNGTASADARFNLRHRSEKFTPKAGKYKISANMTVPQNSILVCEGWNNDTWVKVLGYCSHSSPEEKTFDIDYDGYDRIGLYIQVNNGGVISSPVVIKPMFCDSSESADFEPYYIPLKDSKMSYADNGVLGAKNLLKINNTGVTSKGVTYTVNSDGSVNSSGTSNASWANCDLTQGYQKIPKGKYILSGISGGSQNTYRMVVEREGVTTNINLFDGELELDFDTTYNVKFIIAVSTANVDMSNKIFYPMLRLASDPDDTYVPYALTNKELTDRVNNASDSTVAFTQAESRTNINTGEKLSVLFGKIKKWFADLKTVAFTGSYNDLSDKPEISGGNENVKGTVGWVTKDLIYAKAATIKALNPLWTWNGNVGVQNSVTVTLNLDVDGFVESVNVDGYTASDEYPSFLLFNEVLEDDVEYFVKGCPKGGSVDTYYIYIQTENQGTERDIGDGTYFVGGGGYGTGIFIRLGNSQTFNNILFTPSLHKATDHPAVQDIIGIPTYYIEVKGEDLAGTYQTINEPVVVPDGSITNDKPFKMILKNASTTKNWRTNTNALFVKERSTETVYKIALGKIGSNQNGGVASNINLQYARSTTSYDLIGDYVELDYHPVYGVRNNYTQNNYFQILNANYYPSYGASNFLTVADTEMGIGTTPYLFDVSSNRGYVLFTREYNASSPNTQRGHHAYYIYSPYSESTAPVGAAMASSSASGVTVQYYAAGASAGHTNNQTISVKASAATYLVDAVLYELPI